MKRYLHIIVLTFLLPSCALFDPYRSVTYDQRGSSWQFQVDPETVGYSVEKLAEIDAYVETLSTDAIVVILRGQVLWEYGDTTRLSYLASVRKSILAMLYGNYVENGTIDLDLTLADLGMDDVQGLLPIEKRAAVKDLIAARSEESITRLRILAAIWQRLRCVGRRSQAATICIAIGILMPQALCSNSSPKKTFTMRWIQVSPDHWGLSIGTAASTEKMVTLLAPSINPIIWCYPLVIWRNSVS
jgi:hypothetical protein